MIKPLAEIVNESLNSGDILYLKCRDPENRGYHACGFIKNFILQFPKGTKDNYITGITLQSFYPTGDISGTLNLIDSTYYQPNNSYKYNVLEYDLLKKTNNKPKK